MKIRDTKANKIFMIISLIIVIVLIISPIIAKQDTSKNIINLDNNITVESSSANINVWVDESLDKANLIYKTKDSSKLEIVSDRNGNTVIKEKQKNKLINIKFDNETPTISLYLPSNKVKDLSLKSLSGSIETFSPIVADNLFIDSTSGEVRLFDVKTNEKLEIKTVSADIYLEHVQSNFVKINSTSGDVDAEKIDSSKIYFDNVSGDIYIFSALGDILKITSVSGDIDISSLNIINSISLKSVSGDVEVIDENNSYKYNINSDNGEIEINDRPYSKSFTSKQGVPFSITTVSGEIEINNK